VSAFKGEVGKVIRNRIKAEIGQFVAMCEKSKLRHFGQFLKGGILSRIKAYSVQAQIRRNTPTGNAVRGFLKVLLI
jgi:hypothetical protein